MFSKRLEPLIFSKLRDSLFHILFLFIRKCFEVLKYQEKIKFSFLKHYVKDNIFFNSLLIERNFTHVMQIPQTLSDVGINLTKYLVLFSFLPFTHGHINDGLVWPLLSSPEH